MTHTTRARKRKTVTKRTRSASPAQPPERARSASPAKGTSKRTRRNSAGPSFDPTPFSLSTEYVDGKTGKKQEHLVNSLSHFSKTNQKFRVRRSVFCVLNFMDIAFREVTEIALKNLDECESPESVLAGALAKCIREVYAKHHDVVKFGVKIDSALLDYPVEVPFR